VAAVIDPQQRLVIDTDLSNNAVSRQPQVPAPRVWQIGTLAAQLIMAVIYP
jgi:hypothetical protein